MGPTEGRRPNIILYIVQCMEMFVNLIFIYPGVQDRKKMMFS